MCQEQHGLQIVQAHGLHIFSWVIYQTIDTLHGIGPLFQVNTPDSELPEKQGDLARKMGFTDRYVLAAKGLAEEIALSFKTEIAGLLDFAQLTIGAVFPVRYPCGKCSLALAVNACRYGKVQGTMRAHSIVKRAVSIKFSLCVRKVQKRISSQTFALEGTVKALLLSLGLRMERPAVQGEDAQLHEPHFKSGITHAL